MPTISSPNETQTFPTKNAYMQGWQDTYLFKRPDPSYEIALDLMRKTK